MMNVGRFNQPAPQHLGASISSKSPFLHVHQQRRQLQAGEFTLQSHGIILVTVPTGSGKTATHYSALRLIAASGVNVTAIEDSIENGP
jgi:type II secretory ATPase GspE/PulE/Tfp pilus assembly ATPase PilB-like protein